MSTDKMKAMHFTSGKNELSVGEIPRERELLRSQPW